MVAFVLRWFRVVVCVLIKVFNVKKKKHQIERDCLVYLKTYTFFLKAKFYTFIILNHVFSKIAMLMRGEIKHK